MAPETKFLHKYANCDSDTKKVAQVLEQDRFEPTSNGFLMRCDKKTRYFFSREELERYKNNFPINNPMVKEARSSEVLCVAQVSDFERLLPHVAEMRSFLDSVMENGRGLMFKPQEIFKRAAKSEAITTQIDFSTQWKCRIGISQLGLANIPIEDLIEIYGILLPLFDPYSGIRFEYTKKCAMCGSYYQAKGPKAIYCSEKCRTRARTRRSREEK